MSKSMPQPAIEVNAGSTTHALSNVQISGISRGTHELGSFGVFLRCFA